eukprot:CAMPEP_0174332276 /NCGR_PEP_ID=MMETSP0810-20121108/18171_1 /TAXON_ID=73025 ORGANISM="Eutreptiella gymnastica-like, Strain CCMP1594" /NCGR_SAMPLE_ID=MMETSP0810 /ASSEMBLY_ACC=CAM_ASM_000659 /LENGTH=32 /DNA_ID= /DNA_START= /DNA_END= /DNA_ORIENTATION=
MTNDYVLFNSTRERRPGKVLCGACGWSMVRLL